MARGRPPTFIDREYAAMWRQTHLIPENFKPSTYNGYCCILERHLLPELGSYAMTAITAQEITSMIAKLLKGDTAAEKPKVPVSRKTVRNVLNLLSEILSKARSGGHLRVSPMADVEKMKLEQDENIYYVQRQMGHSSVNVTIDIYGHLVETRKPEAAAKTDALRFGKT